MNYFDSSNNEFEKSIDILSHGHAIKALVIGDVILDKYTYGKIERLSTGITIPIIDIYNREFCLGGAGNIAANLKQFVNEVSIIGLIGKDNDANELMNLLENHEVQSRGLINLKQQTLSKERVYVSDQQLYRLDNCLRETLSFDVFKKIFDDIVQDKNLVVISDYDYGVCNEEITKYIIEYTNRNKIVTVATSRSCNWDKYVDINYLAVNREEFSNMLNSFMIDPLLRSSLISKQVLKRLKCNGMLITMGNNGLLYAESEDEYHHSLDAVYPVNVSGAGDTVLALFSAICIFQKNKELCLNLLNIAGRIAVSEKMTYVLSKDKLISEYYSHLRKNNCYNKIVHSNVIEILVQAWKREGYTIVFTNGCFDILHPGHIKCLQEAKKLGDKLVVGINSDSSIKEIKGENRPINSENQRIITLASLEMIDCVIMFQESNAVNLIKKVNPTIYVKGDEYKNKMLPEAEYAETVIYIENIEKLSTTNVISKIVNNI